MESKLLIAHLEMVVDHIRIDILQMLQLMKVGDEEDKGFRIG